MYILPAYLPCILLQSFSVIMIMNYDPFRCYYSLFKRSFNHQFLLELCFSHSWTIRLTVQMCSLLLLHVFQFDIMYLSADIMYSLHFSALNFIVVYYLHRCCLVSSTAMTFVVCRIKYLLVPLQTICFYYCYPIISNQTTFFLLLFL